jgi:GT2 family glycosyltransferase
VSRHGIVAIGRNEGARLVRCLASLGARDVPVVYVDSGSKDGSQQVARDAGARLVELDSHTPFTAARARNVGWRELLRMQPGLEFVQFVDGDCELASGWTDVAVRALDVDASLAVVFGRRRERNRNATPWNRLCDMEWDVSPGRVLSCGGDAMVRVRALAEVGGYEDSLIAGEEPDLCFRLRGRGWQVECIAAEMTLHDADMHRFSQWWRRSVRWGHVLAEGVARRGFLYPGLRRAFSACAWTFGFAALAVLLHLLAGPVAFQVVACCWVGGLAAIWCRSFVHVMRRGVTRADAALYASSCVGGKFAQARGMVGYWLDRLLRRRSRLIEYKFVADPQGRGGPVA